jgi:hypothetical protein
MLLLSKRVAKNTSTQVFHFRVSILFLKVSELLGFRFLPMNWHQLSKVVTLKGWLCMANWMELQTSWQHH